MIGLLWGALAWFMWMNLGFLSFVGGVFLLATVLTCRRIGWSATYQQVFAEWAK